MTEKEITFHNKAEIKVQAQVYTGRALVDTCVAASGEIRTLSVELTRYDVFFRDGATGWVIARVLDSQIERFTLSQFNGRYTVIRG